MKQELHIEVPHFLLRQRTTAARELQQVEHQGLDLGGDRATIRVTRDRAAAPVVVGVGCGVAVAVAVAVGTAGGTAGGGIGWDEGGGLPPATAAAAAAAGARTGTGAVVVERGSGAGTC